MRGGWFEAAFERELVGDITPVVAGGRRLMLVAAEGRVRAFDAVCPHRGADLGRGGVLDGGAVVCPFHGHRVALGAGGEGRFCVSEYPALGYGGMIFVRVAGPDAGLEDRLDALAASHVFVPGFVLRIPCPPELVIENAFDSDHFGPVHGVSGASRFEVGRDGAGALVATGDLELPRSRWHRVDSEVARVGFETVAVSPYLVISSLRGDFPYTVLTGATPAAGGETIVRLSLAVPKSDDGAPPDRDLCLYLIEHSREGLAADAAIWEHLTPLDRPSFTKEDRGVVGFQRYCAGFDV